MATRTATRRGKANEIMEIVCADDLRNGEEEKDESAD